MRDRALLAFGMAGALRRWELVALTVADLERGPDGIQVRVVRSKTGQESRGMVIAVPDSRRLSPMPHPETWLARTGISKGTALRAHLKGEGVPVVVLTAKDVTKEDRIRLQGRTGCRPRTDTSPQSVVDQLRALTPVPPGQADPNA